MLGVRSTLTGAVALAALSLGLVSTPAGAGVSGREALTATYTSTLEGVTVVPGTKEALAVGTAYASNYAKSYDLIDQWTGSSWKLMSAPSSSSNESLSSVWAASKSDAWAVGNGTTAPQVLHWNGTKWSTATITGLPSGSTLLSVSGTSASNVWIVGMAFTSTNSVPVEAHFNGTAWKVMQDGPSGASLTAVSVASATSAWAVGYATNGVLVLQYNGSTWKTVKTKAPSTANLSGVSAHGSDVWLVGSVYDAKTEAQQLFSEELSNGSWATKTMAKPSGANPRASAVVLLGSGVAYAAGEINNSSNTNWSAFADRFSNGKWTLEKLPPGGNGASVAALAATAADNIWGVGSYFTGKVCTATNLPLAYQHTSTWTLSKPPNLASPASRTAPRC